MNHFPGMSELAKKNLLAKNLNRMVRALPADFSWVPQTFLLPAELEPLRSWAAAQKRKPTIIVKPDAGCQGRGACRPTRLLTTLNLLYSLEGRKPTPQPLTKPNPNPQYRHLHARTLTLTTGIFMTKSLEDCADCEGMVAQQYLHHPLLVEGVK